MCVTYSLFPGSTCDRPGPIDAQNLQFLTIILEKSVQRLQISSS